MVVVRYTCPPLDLSNIRRETAFPLPGLVGIVAPTDPPDPPEGNDDHTLWWAQVGDGHEIPIPATVIEEMRRSVFPDVFIEAGDWERCRQELNTAAARVAERASP